MLQIGPVLLVIHRSLYVYSVTECMVVSYMYLYRPFPPLHQDNRALLEFRESLKMKYLYFYVHAITVRLPFCPGIPGGP
jgi:hypothetical protein